jgi:hypothetical protein
MEEGALNHMQRSLSRDPRQHELGEDWAGNNAACTCPLCKKVFIVSGAKNIHDGKRECPDCGRSIGTVRGGRKSGGSASIDW